MSICKLTNVTTSSPTALALQWDDDRVSHVDLAALIASRPNLAPLGDPAEFEQTALSDDGWSAEWLCGIDFGSQQLRRWAEEQAGEIMPIDAFRAWMVRHNLTLDRTADVLGLSRRTIAYYLSGEQPIPKTVMLATEGYDHRRAA
jgi:hypothetical protein